MLRHKKNLANIITFSRIIGVVFILWAMPYHTLFIQTWIIVIYTVTCLTDILDGWAARKYKLTSDLGKILDPLADKLLVLIFLPLLTMNAISAFPVFIILGREFAIMGVRVFAAKSHTIISASFSGKLKTALTLPVLGILIARIPAVDSPVPMLLMPLSMLVKWVQSWPSWCFDGLIWGVVAVTVWSFFDYLWKFMMSKQRVKQQPKDAKRFLVLIPNTITLLNLSCGLFAILNALIQHFQTAAALILLGCIFDACDGMIARKLNVNSKLGKQLDTSTDFLTFGIAPAILLYNIITDLHGGVLFVFLGLALGLVYGFAIFYRLRRFTSSESSPYFKGLPAPGGAAIVVFLAATPLAYQPVIFSIAVVANILVSVSTFPYPHNRVSHTKLGFPIIQKVALCFWVIHIVLLVGFPTVSHWPIAEINLFLMCVYAASPIWPTVKQT